MVNKVPGHATKITGTITKSTMPKLKQTNKQTNKQTKQRLSNRLLPGNLADEQETSKTTRQTVVLIDKDKHPVGKLGTLYPLNMIDE
jgi:hypothetical protein